MKKRILAIMLIAALSTGLSGCAGNTANTNVVTSAAAESSEKVGEQEDKSMQGSSWEPSSAVSIIVPAGAGGNTDLSARVFAEYAKRMTGHDFVVVNAGGAAGSVASQQVKAAAADGHTFLYGHTLVNVANIAGVTDYNYTAFTLGPNFAKDPAQGLYVNAEKYADLNEFIEAAKARPGELKACTEVGAYTYYELLAFEKEAGIDLDLVDVGSNSDKIAAMLSGQVDLMPGAYINTKDYLEAGKFRCIGVPTKERYELISDIPTLAEQGIDLVYPDCDFSFYFPEGTSEDIVAWYDNLVKGMMEDKEAAEMIRKVEMMPYYLSPEQAAENEETMYNTIKTIADSLK